MTSSYIAPLIKSFPWLTEAEAAGVAEQLGHATPSKSAADHLAALATILDQAGLPPTSTLLLTLAGRGSKDTAVSVAREFARARFDKAQKAVVRDHGAGESTAVAATAGAPWDEGRVRQLVQATVESALSMMPGAFAGGAIDDRALRLLEGVSGEVRWLRSTIDTERQLRRYREAHGPLPEHQAPQGPAAPAQRRDVVQQLAGSLERDRFGSQAGRAVDSADGREE